MEGRRFEILEMVQEGRIDARTAAELMQAAEQCPSTEEALRILRMFRENKVTINEAKELLLAMARPEPEEKPPETALTPGKDWWAGLARWKKMAIGAAIVFSVWFFLATQSFGLKPPFIFSWPPGVLFMLVLAFWVWMFIDCIRREHLNFGRIFSPGGRYEKLVWLGILAFTGIIGAIAYFLAVKRREISLPRQIGKEIKLPPSEKMKVIMERVETRVSVVPLILLDAICILFALGLSTGSVWFSLPFLHHYLTLPSLVITVTFILFFAIFGLYGRKGRSLVRIFCAVALPLLLLWLIIQIRVHWYEAFLPPYYFGRGSFLGLHSTLPKNYLSHLNRSLLQFGFLCFLFVGLYRKIFFRNLTRERVIVIERSG